MMKAIVALALLIAVASAQFCVSLERTDERCVGHQSNWPIKVCSNTEANVNSATYCDTTDVTDPYTNWVDQCPLKNVDNATFCEGTGYDFAGLLSTFCNANWIGCSENVDCDTAVPAVPVAEVPISDAPVATPPPFCYECCLFCFESAECETMLEAVVPIYTNDTVCSPCFAEPVTPPTSDTQPESNVPQDGPVAVPSTVTPRASPITPRASSAASVVASASLIVAAALLA